MKATPIVKWAGGKTRLLPQLMAKVPKHYNRYYEPFVGGAALFFALSPAQAVLNDVNSSLISLYRAVVVDVDMVIKVLQDHKTKHVDPEYYYTVRTLWNDPAVRKNISAAESAAMFIYLNKTCFNGLWRENKKGEFNVPRGDYNNPTIFEEGSLRSSARALSRAIITNTNFHQATLDAGPGDFVYFDPPYDPLSSTSNFTSYSAGAFSSQEQRALADCARSLVARGVHVLLSNSDTFFIRELYNGFDLEVVSCSRPINSKASGRGKIDELIISSRRA